MARPFGTKNIETPEKLWDLFCAYEKQTKETPIKVQDYVGKDGDMVYRDKEVPLTIEGFECYCFDEGIISDLSRYFSNDGESYNDYRTICSHIKKKVRADQIKGGMAGIYNHSITQRLNNLVERQANEITATIKKMPWMDE